MPSYLVFGLDTFPQLLCLCCCFFWRELLFWLRLDEHRKASIHATVLYIGMDATSWHASLPAVAPYHVCSSAAANCIAVLENNIVAEHRMLYILLMASAGSLT